MAFQLRSRAERPLRCRFAVSPLREVEEAVRSVRRSPYLGQPPWLRRIRLAAAGLDLSPLWLLDAAERPFPDFLRPPPEGPPATVEGELARVRATDPARAHEELTRSLTAAPAGAESARACAMLGDPARAVALLADLLELVWRAVLEPHWTHLRPLLEADVAFHTRRLAADGPPGLFAELHPRLSWARDVLSVSDAPVDAPSPGVPRQGGGPRGTAAVRLVEAEDLLLMPSVLCGPDAVDASVRGPHATVVYPARAARGLWSTPAGGAPEALSRLLGRGRAAVLAALADPSTTTALAHELGFAPSSVSAHLTALRDAGLLASHRHGHQVLYERTPLGIALCAG